MKKQILTATLLFLFMGMIYAQECTLKWTHGNTSRAETFDFEWGNDKGVRDPYKLGLITDNGIVTGTAALRELQKPIWGDGTQTFGELLPYVPKPVKQYLRRKAYPWYALSDTMPSTSQPKGYECHAQDGKLFQGLTVETAPLWGAMSIVEWRPWNPSPNQSIFIELNPEYPVVEAWRAESIAEWERVISSTFVQTAYYIFPTFKYAEGARWYMKCEGDPDWIEYPVDKLNPLSGDGGYVKHRQAVKPSDRKPWSSFYTRSLYLKGDNRLKKLLGI